MANFAEINFRGKVKRVIVADQEFINSGAVGNPENWVETHEENYAGIGYSYDKKTNKFIEPKPCYFCSRIRSFFSVKRPCKDCPNKK